MNHSLSLFLKNLFFPVFCVGCGAEGCFICEACAQKINKFSNPWIADKKFQPIQKVFAPFIYEETGIFAELIRLFKYQFAHEIHETLLELMHPHLLKNKTFFEKSILVPVPLHKKRKLWRGFNQADFIANDIGKILEIPVLPLLTRTKNTKPQAELTRVERINNVKEAFELMKIPEKIPRKIFLVDDVISTGSTLVECAKAIRKFFDIEINAVVLARPV